MKYYTIKIHSFVDLITNSSTEIYIQATDKTIETIKKLIDNILEIGGSTLHCDDLFDISLDKERLFKDSYYDVDPTMTAEQFYEETVSEYSSSRDIYISVKPKDPNSEAAKSAAKVLENLTGLFGITAEYNG